jgi:hypothetical protein
MEIVVTLPTGAASPAAKVEEKSKWSIASLGRGVWAAKRRLYVSPGQAKRRPIRIKLRSFAVTALRCQLGNLRNFPS